MKSNLDEALKLAETNLAYWKSKLKPWYKFAWNDNATVRQRIAKWTKTVKCLRKIKNKESVYVREA